MKLSEAIRKGCVKPQGTGPWSIKTDNDTHCVLGAAGVGAGIHLENNQQAYDVLEARFPILKERVVNPPMVIRHMMTGATKLSEVLWYTNDVHGWTRERLADFVEEVEAEYEECHGK